MSASRGVASVEEVFGAVALGDDLIQLFAFSLLIFLLAFFTPVFFVRAFGFAAVSGRSNSEV